MFAQKSRIYIVESGEWSGVVWTTPDRPPIDTRPSVQPPLRGKLRILNFELRDYG